jgi:hypothetical protein
MVKSITKASRFRITFISWWLVWILVDTGMVISSYGAGFTQSIIDSLVCNLAIGGLLPAYYQ